MLWIATEGCLDQFDPINETFTRYQHDSNNPNSLSNDFIWVVYKDRIGIMWIGTEGGLNRLDPNTKTFSSYQHDKDNPHSLNNNTVISIYEDKANLLWIGVWVLGLDYEEKLKKC